MPDTDVDQAAKDHDTADDALLPWTGNETDDAIAASGDASSVAQHLMAPVYRDLPAPPTETPSTSSAAPGMVTASPEANLVEHAFLPDADDEPTAILQPAPELNATPADADPLNAASPALDVSSPAPSVSPALDASRALDDADPAPTASLLADQARELQVDDAHRSAIDQEALVSIEPEVATAADDADRLITSFESFLAEASPAPQPLPEPQLALAKPVTVVAPVAETQPEPEMALEVEPAQVGVSGGAWTIPLLCLGLGLIACCVIIPTAEQVRQLAFERAALQSSLESVQKQGTINDEFLKKVMEDPELAERLASRQMKTIRKGQRVLDLSSSESKVDDIGPFALTTAPAAPAPPQYKPLRGTIADLCNEPHARLYLMGVAMTMVAAGLVLGSASARSPES